MKLGNKDIVKAYLGDQPLSKVMLGDMEIANFAPSPPVNELTDYAVAPNTFADGNWKFDGVGFSSWAKRDANGVDREAALLAIPVGYHIRVTEGDTGNSFTAVVLGATATAFAVAIDYEEFEGDTVFTNGNSIKLEWQESAFDEFDFGNCLEFTNVTPDTYGLINDAWLPTDQSEWTYNVWISPLAEGIRVLLGSTASNNDFITMLIGAIRIDIGGNRTFNIDSIPINEWSMVTLSNSNTIAPIGCTLYFNGELISTQGNVNVNVAMDIIAGRLSTANQYLGKQDDLFLGNSPVTQAQVTQAYNSGQGADVKTIFTDPYLIYHMDSIEGTQILDSSGNGNHGTLMNPTGVDWVAHDDGEVEAVIARMTDPSPAFQVAIREYISAEQAAVNDNWALTDNVLALDVDSEVNALTLWKDGTITPSGTPIFTLYDGMFFNNETGDTLLTDLIPATNGGNWSGTNMFFTSVSKQLFELLNSSNYRAHWSIVNEGDGTDRTFFRGQRNDTDTQFDMFVGGGLLAIYPDRTEATQFESNSIWIGFKDATETYMYQNGSQFGRRDNVFSDPKHGRIQFASYDSVGAASLQGTMIGGAYGGGVGLDFISHTANMRKFHDRMLIQKHIATVQPVLDRYTNLSSVESFAIGRLVARSVENGNWGLLDEVFFTTFAEQSNAQIGMFSKTITDPTASVFISGGGFACFGTSARLITDWDSSIDAVNEKLDDGIKGMVTSGQIGLQDAVVYYQWYQGTGSYSFRYNGRIIDGRYQSNAQNRLTSQVRENTTVALWRIAPDQCLMRGNDIEGETTNGAFTLDVGLAMIGGRASYDSVQGNVKAWFVGGGIGFDWYSWKADLNQAINEIEIAFNVPNIDWNVQDKTYDWQYRIIAPDQLENLLQQITMLSDDTTTGRTLDIQGNLGVTMNAQNYIDSLVSKGWNVILT